MRTVVAVLRRRNGERVGKVEFQQLLSFDLRWFAPADAKSVLSHAIKTGLLAEEDEQVRATFPTAAVEVPLSFRPGLEILDERPVVPKAAERTLLARLIEAVEGAGGSEREVEDERLRRGGLVTKEVAAVLVAKRRGVDVSVWIPDVYATLRKS